MPTLFQTAATSSLPAGAPRPPPNPSWPEEKAPRMPKTNQVNWQPIGQMPLIASMIDTSLNDTREHLSTLTKAKDRPHVLDDATIDRVEQVHTEQMNYVEIYTQQISRWRKETMTAVRIPMVQVAFAVRRSARSEGVS